VGDEVTDTTGDQDMARWTEALRQLRRTAQRFEDLCVMLAPVMRPNETPEEAITRLVTP